jgi:hypothetical protein
VVRQMRRSRRSHSDGPFYALVNKNLLNFPLARDDKFPPAWGDRPAPSIWKLPEDGDYSEFEIHDGITLVCHHENEEELKLRRCPTALDMKVLLLLLAMRTMALSPHRHKEAFRRGSETMDQITSSLREGTVQERRHRLGEYIGGRFVPRTIKEQAKAAYRQGWKDAARGPSPKEITVDFDSWATVSRWVGISPSSRSAQALRDSLRFWSLTKIRYDCWFSKGGVRAPRTVGPIVRSLKNPRKPRGALSVVVSGDAFDTASGYYARVPLHLPTRSATATNLIFWLLAFQRSEAAAPSRSLDNLVDVLGIPAKYDSEASRGLDRALDVVNSWYATQDADKWSKAKIELPAGVRIAQGKTARTMKLVFDRRTKPDENGFSGDPG